MLKTYHIKAITKFDSAARGAISRRFIAEIIEVRLAEIFEFVHAELRNMGRAGQLPGGIVITGGGAKLPGIIDLAKQEFRLPARVGFPDYSGLQLEHPDLHTALEDPEYSCAVGLALMGIDRQYAEARPAFFDVSGWARKFLNYFLP